MSTVKTVINKYGKIVHLPDTKNTFLENEVEHVLEELGVDYQKQYSFDEKGIRRYKYDFAVMDNGLPKLLIEADGEPHYSPDFFRSTGVRDCRCDAHVVKTMMSDANKDRIAAQKNIPLLRIRKEHLDNLRRLLISYIAITVDGISYSDCPEAAMVMAMDKYGWDFEYVYPSELSRKEEAFLLERERTSLTTGADA